MMINKKAQEMSTNTIILIVLGLIVLVVLIIGFTMGFNNLKEKIIPSNNVQTIADQCGMACNLNQAYDYCTKELELKTGKETLTGVTCYLLNIKKAEYKIPACPTMSCGIYNTKDEAKAYCTAELTAAAGDTIKIAAANAKEVFYIEELKLIKAACSTLP